MALKDIIFKIKADNKNAKKGMKELEKQTGILTNKFKALGATIGLSIGGKFIIDAFLEQEKAEKALEVALGRVNNELLKHAAALQKATAFGDEQIIQGMALLAAFVKEEGQIKKLTESVLDLATAKNMDLFAAFDLVAKTVGSSTNALSRYGVQVEGAANSTARLESAVQSISDLYAGQARARIDTFGGRLQNFKNQIGDIAEVILSNTLPALNLVLDVFSSLTTAIGALFQAIKTEQASTAELVALLPQEELETLYNESKRFKEWWDKEGSKITGRVIGQKIDIAIQPSPEELRKQMEDIPIMEQSELANQMQTIVDGSAKFGDEMAVNIQSVEQMNEEFDLTKLLMTELRKIFADIKTTTKDTTNTLDAFKIRTEKQIKAEIEIWERLRAQETSYFNQLQYLERIFKLQDELKRFEAPALEVPLEDLPEDIILPDEKILTPEELREKFKEFDIIANASAQTFKETFGKVLSDLFGDNSLLQKFLSKTFGGFFDQITTKLGGSIFGWLTSLIPGGTFLTGLFSGAGRIAGAGGGTLVIQNNIAGEEINTVMVDLVPNAINRATRVRKL